MAHRATSRSRKNLFGFGKAKPGRISGKHRRRAPTFEGSSTIREIAFDQGYNDARKGYDRNLESSEIPEYISGQKKSKEWLARMGVGRIAQIYRHDYAQGKKKWQAEEKKEAKGEASSVVKDVTDALVGQGMKKSQAISKAKAAFKSGQSFEETFRKAMQGTGKTSKMSANPPNFKLYYAAKEADDRFQRALVKEYGTRAGDMRYKTSQQTPAIRKLGDAKKKADAAWLSEMRRKNPARFDRCVAAVTKSLKARKKPGNAYAICAAAGTRNPESAHQLIAKGWHLVDRYSTRASAEAVSQKYPPYRLIGRFGKWEVWTRQKTAVVNASARARSKAETSARHPRKAPTTKAKGNPVLWSARQGKLKATITKSLVGPYKLRIMGGPRVLEEYTPKKFDEAVAIARLRLAESRLQNPKATTADLVPGGGSFVEGLNKSLHAWKGVAKRVTRGVSRPFRASKSRKNPMDVALKRYEEFHGMPSAEILEFEEKEHHHSAKVGLGQLVSLLVTLVNGKTVPLNSPGFTEKGSNGRKYWEFDDKTPIIKRVYLTSSEDGKQLFIDGGDQAIPTDALRALGLTADDEHDHMLIGTIQMVTYRTRKSFEGKGKEEVDFHHTLGTNGSRGIMPVLLYFPRSQKLRIAGGRYKIAPPRRDLGNVSPGIVG